MGLGAAIGYDDPDFGRSTVCPESSARAARNRLEQTRMTAAATESAGQCHPCGDRAPQTGAASRAEGHGSPSENRVKAMRW